MNNIEKNMFNRLLILCKSIENVQWKAPFLAALELSAFCRNVGAFTQWGAGTCNVVFSDKGLCERCCSLDLRSDIEGRYLVSGLPRRYTVHLSKPYAVAASVNLAVFLCPFIRAQSVFMAGCGAVNKALPNSRPGLVWAVRESRHPLKGGAAHKPYGGHIMPDNRKILSCLPRFTSLICSQLVLVSAALLAVPGCGSQPLEVGYV